MKKLLLAALLALLPSLASAQCNGVFPNNTACGNISGSGNLPRAIPLTSFPANAPGGIMGQIQINAGGGLFGGLTDAQATARMQVFTSILSGAVPASGGGTVNYLRADGTFAPPPSGGSNAAQFGITCDGVTDDGPAFTTAFTALAGAPLVLPAGTCRIATGAYQNVWVTPPGALTAPSFKVFGQGRGVTKIEVDVANGYALSNNPDWLGASRATFQMAAGTAGSLATNTYFVWITTTDPGGNEILTGTSQSRAVTGPNGSISVPLNALHAGYCYNLYIGTVSLPVNRATVSGVDAICLAGGGTSVITAVGSAAVIPLDKRSVWGESEIRDLSFVNDTATANTSAVLWFRVGYSTWQNVYTHGMSLHGLHIPNWNGDGDGSFVVTVDKSKFDDISGWCLNAGGNTLEFSNFTVSNSVFNLCGEEVTGTNVNVTMTAITNANPGRVTTASNHNLLVDDQIFIVGVLGMSLPSNNYRVCGTVTATQFDLCSLNGNNVNTTALGAYTASSGVEQLGWRPPKMASNGDGPTVSGAISYTGLISNFLNNGFTQNKNTNIYFTEAGANDMATFIGNDFENTAGKGAYIASAAGQVWLNNECLTASGLGSTISCVQFGTGANRGGAKWVTMDGWKVRSDIAGASVAGFEQLAGAGGLIYQHTISVKNVNWQSFVAGTKYLQFNGNPFPLFWARFDGRTGSVCTLKDSFNIATCVRNGTGDYTLTFNEPSLDADYSISGTGANTGTNIGFVYLNNLGNLTTTAARFLCVNPSVAAQDCDIVNITGHGRPQ